MAPKNTKSTKTRAAKNTRVPRVKSAPKVTRPVFRTGTWVALIAFIAIIAAAIYMNRQAEEKAAATETPAAEEAFIFPEDTVVTSIEVKPEQGDTVKIERNEEKVWVLSLPEDAEADQGAAEAAASQVGALSIVTTIEGNKDPSIFGLDVPVYTITITFEDGKTSILEVGDSTPTDSGYYVRVDGDKVYVVSPSGIDALASLTFAPPYLNTPTPVPTATSTPLPTEMPAPATEATPTP
ncbi:MAG: DUF4340 domain-containing protein [Chloroflexi bacterium]|nr:DUF4340 domain-containing protein [Chloroflexota bacterium]MBI3170566.1 DUF4340 domain-containing protein [Chloroflexota bacterium]